MPLLGKSGSGILSDVEIALYMLKAGFPPNPRVLAEGIGVVRAESGGNPKSKVPGNEHIGMWAESTAFGTDAERLDPLASTRAAFKQWKADGMSFYPAWGRWEAEQAGTDGSTTWKEHLAGVRQALLGGGKAPSGTAGGAFRAQAAPAAAPAGHGPSGFMVFLLTAGLVLGGIAMMGLGTVRGVGAASGKTALEAAA